MRVYVRNYEGHSYRLRIKVNLFGFGYVLFYLVCLLFYRKVKLGLCASRDQISV